MTRNEFIRKVAKKVDGVKVAQVREVFNVAQEVVTDVIKDRDRVKLLNCLWVSGEDKAARRMRNPYTGGYFEMPSRLVPKALFGDDYKRSIRNE